MLNRRLLGREMSEQCEMIFQQTDVATNRFHDNVHISLKACFTHGLFRVIRRLFRRRMTRKDINKSKILIVVTGSSVSFPNQTCTGLRAVVVRRDKNTIEVV